MACKVLYTLLLSVMDHGSALCGGPSSPHAWYIHSRICTLNFSCTRSNFLRFYAITDMIRHPIMDGIEESLGKWQKYAEQLQVIKIMIREALVYLANEWMDSWRKLAVCGIRRRNCCVLGEIRSKISLGIILNMYCNSLLLRFNRVFKKKSRYCVVIVLVFPSYLHKTCNQISINIKISLHF